MAQPVENTDDSVQEAQVPIVSGRGNKILVIILGVLLLISTNVAVFLYFVGSKAEVTHKSAKSEPIDQAEQTDSNKDISSGEEQVTHGEEDTVDNSEQEPSLAVYKSIELPFVVNFEQPAPVRFLQITVELQAKKQGAFSDVERHMPVIRNNLLMLFGNQKYEEVRTREGKEKLRQEALAEIRSILKSRAGKSEIDDVYFTAFVMQ